MQEEGQNSLNFKLGKNLSSIYMAFELSWIAENEMAQSKISLVCALNKKWDVDTCFSSLKMCVATGQEQKVAYFSEIFLQFVSKIGPYSLVPISKLLHNKYRKKSYIIPSSFQDDTGLTAFLF